MTAILLILSLTYSEPPQVCWLVFGASWCGPCKQAEADFKPWLQKSGWEIKRKGESSGTARVWQIDGDKFPESVQEWQVASYPTFVLLVNGEEVKRHVGYPGRRVLVAEYAGACRR